MTIHVVVSSLTHVQFLFCVKSCLFFRTFSFQIGIAVAFIWGNCTLRRDTIKINFVCAVDSASLVLILSSVTHRTSLFYLR